MNRTIDITKLKSVLSLDREVLSYEKLWARRGATYKSIHEQFMNSDSKLPSDILSSQMDFLLKEEDLEIKKLIRHKAPLTAMVRTRPQFSEGLNDMKHPIALFYYDGDIELSLSDRIVSIVGTRNSTPEGKKNTIAITRSLVEKGYTVVSGLARGIDTIALETAIEHNGKVIGVIGTPIDQYYPKENIALQNEIKRSHLLISHVPFYRYSKDPFSAKKYYFPQRNAMMAAIAHATIIIEASETSGTQSQARECAHMKKPLFILKNCFEKNLSWVKNYHNRNIAVRIDSLNQLHEEMDTR